MIDFRGTSRAGILLVLFGVSCATANDSAELRSIHPPLPPATATTGRARHVVVISIDGLRPDAISQADARAMLALMKAGAHCPRACTVRPPITLPSHTSMLTGLDVAHHGVTWNSYRPGAIDRPTIFSVASAAHLSTAMLFAKPKFCYLACPGSVHWVYGPVPESSPFVPHEHGSLAADHEKTRRVDLPATVHQQESPSPLPPTDPTAEALAAAFSQEWPRSLYQLTFIHLREVDGAGHRSGWMSPAYLDAVRDADRAVGAIVETIRSAGELGETAVILTSDHGGKGCSHDGALDSESRTIPWICIGPGVQAGLVIEREIRTYDTAPTALAFLGVKPPPGLDGSAVS